MKYSKMFGKTLRGKVAETKFVSHKWLVKGGFVAESSAGRFYLLPLGWRVHEKIKAVIKEEMDRAGAQEMITPVLHPLGLWKETNRTDTAGFELMTVKDRRKVDFALGGTAEEMFVDLVRKYKLSYRELPFNVYQFSTKFRDELRARGGLLRVREFVMKDAYSFHRDEADFRREYELMAETYLRIFDRLGLETFRTAAGNGYIGGEYSHEFQTPAENGEDLVFYAKSVGEWFNQEVAPSRAPDVSYQEEEAKLEEVEGRGIVGVEELAKYLKIPVEKTTKTLLYKADDRVIAAAVRGGYEMNEEKLRVVCGVKHLELADEKLVKELTGADLGYAGLINLADGVEVLVDESCAGRVNFEMGANKTNYHSINVNWGRDMAEPEKYVDIKEAREGDLHPETGEEYQVFRAIEVGNIFQLGYHYTKLMKGAVYVDEDGKDKPYYMGCYGIGLGRTMAAIGEKYADDRGIVWPNKVAPYNVHLVSLIGGEEIAVKIYKELVSRGMEVLWDDREESAGVKLADADLIGCPVRLVVSKRNGDKVEWKRRSGAEVVTLSLVEVVERLGGKKES